MPASVRFRSETGSNGQLCCLKNSGWAIELFDSRLLDIVCHTEGASTFIVSIDSLFFCVEILFGGEVFAH